MGKDQRDARAIARRGRIGDGGHVLGRRDVDADQLRHVHSLVFLSPRGFGLPKCPLHLGGFVRQNGPPLGNFAHLGSVRSPKIAPQLAAFHHVWVRFVFPECARSPPSPPWLWSAKIVDTLASSAPVALVCQTLPASRASFPLRFQQASLRKSCLQYIHFVVNKIQNVSATIRLACKNKARDGADQWRSLRPAPDRQHDRRVSGACAHAIQNGPERVFLCAAREAAPRRTEQR